MHIFNSIGTSAFYAVLLGVLITAVLAVTVRNLFHAALFLAFTLLGVAIIYFFLHAEFIAVIQILVYVGAIMTLVIFAIMLTSRIGDMKISQSNKQQIWALFPVLIITFAVLRIVRKFPWSISQTPNSVDVLTLGKALMNQYVLPFEVISVVLLIALVGAIVIARND